MCAATIPRQRYGHLAIGFLLGIPTIAIIALVRTGRLRRRLDEDSWEYREKISELEKEITGLRRDLAQLSRRVEEPGAAMPPLVPVETGVPKPHIDHSIHLSEDAVPASLDRQAVLAPELKVFLKQSDLDRAVDRSKTAGSAGAIPNAEPALPVNLETNTDAIPTSHPSPPQPPKPREAVQPLCASVRTAPHFATLEAMPPRKSFAERLRATLPPEELLGMNLFAKIGIVLLVLGLRLAARWPWFRWDRRQESLSSTLLPARCSAEEYGWKEKNATG